MVRLRQAQPDKSVYIKWSLCHPEPAEGHLKLNNYLIKQGGFGNAIDMNIQLDDK